MGHHLPLRKVFAQLSDMIKVIANRGSRTAFPRNPRHFSASIRKCRQKMCHINPLSFVRRS